MGTRSLTYVKGEYDKNNRSAVCIYQQYDGYPEGVGQTLADFAKDFTIVNGFGGDEQKAGTHANGGGCFAAQLVAHLKTEIGGVYLYPTEADQDAGQEFEYELYVTAGAPVQIKCFEVHYKEGKTCIIDCEAKDFAEHAAAWTALQYEGEDTEAM